MKQIVEVHWPQTGFIHQLSLSYQCYRDMFLLKFINVKGVLFYLNGDKWPLALSKQISFISFNSMCYSTRTDTKGRRVHSLCIHNGPETVTFHTERRALYKVFNHISIILNGCIIHKWTDAKSDRYKLLRGMTFFTLFIMWKGQTGTRYSAFWISELQVRLRVNNLSV